MAKLKSKVAQPRSRNIYSGGRRNTTTSRIYRVDKKSKSETWESVLAQVQSNISYAKQTFYGNSSVNEIKMNLPFGVIRDQIPRIGWADGEIKTIYPLAKFIIRNKKQGNNYITTMTIELKAGTLISTFFKRNRKYKYRIDKQKKVWVSYNIVSDTHLEWQLNEYINECNNLRLVYCI